MWTQSPITDRWKEAQLFNILLSHTGYAAAAGLGKLQPTSRFAPPPDCLRGTTSLVIATTRSRDDPVNGYLAGGATVTIATGQSDFRGIAVDSANVYWAVAGTAANGYVDGTVMSAPLGGGTPKTLATGQRTPTAIAVDSTNIYWVHIHPRRELIAGLEREPCVSLLACAAGGWSVTSRT